MKNAFSPLSETAYYILLSLMQERHGYGIMQFVSTITNGRINLGAGTIYGTLGKLEKAELIEITKKEEKRKYYLITNTGKELLEYEIQRICELYHNGKEIIDGK
ncbi:helix-turn-helix transcriptional regulator [Sedimentibacter sp. zth1]|uniref:PadR family transcriptional regulator n=1 Tax=Sedimentibacter sp. zth1 TaxID=2816908 RepID=UPI001A917537|nr:PadR family transcriptional regulator [Sedimentibacter sp. zth1]QSX05686.1 helix-turn-helix transcriptional regulator [Sedimentibacter sp. zth1]